MGNLRMALLTIYRGKYSATKIVDEIVRKYLSAIKTTPKDKALELRYKKELADKRKLKRELEEKKKQLQRRLKELSLEVGKSLCGENKFPVDVLSMSIDSTKAEIEEADKQIHLCNVDLEQQSDVLGKLDYHYNQFVSWADEYDRASSEQKKMILCQLIDEVNVGRGYNIEIKFNISYKQFFGEDNILEEVVNS